jgi:hypothetical protein
MSFSSGEHILGEMRDTNLLSGLTSTTNPIFSQNERLLVLGCVPSLEAY